MTIQWGYHFLTGIKPIDRQHESLVALMNDLHAAADRRSVSKEIDDAFRALRDYAAEHFALEERLMADAGVAPESLGPHKEAHAAFVNELTELWESRDRGEKTSTAQLLEFLTTWIYRHILITDHAMARDYYRRKGMTPPPSLLLSTGTTRFSGH